MVFVPGGCGCECGGCDQGHHCDDGERGCFYYSEGEEKDEDD